MAIQKTYSMIKPDGVRNGLADLGFVIEDTPQGARVMFEG